MDILALIIPLAWSLYYVFTDKERQRKKQDREDERNVEYGRRKAKLSQKMQKPYRDEIQAKLREKFTIKI